MLFPKNIAIINGCTEPNFKMTSTKNTKKPTKKASLSQKKTLSSTPAAVHQKAADVLEKLKNHFEPEKVNAFQEKWLAVPANRKKYEKITDAPQVAAEEILAMTNDLIDYIQGEKTRQSTFLQKIKKGVSGFFKNPAQYVQEKTEQGAEKVNQVGEEVKSATEEQVSKMEQSAEKKVKKMTKTAPKTSNKPSTEKKRISGTRTKK